MRIALGLLLAGACSAPAKVPAGAAQNAARPAAPAVALQAPLPLAAPDPLLDRALREWPGAAPVSRLELRLEGTGSMAIPAAPGDACYRVFVDADSSVSARAQGANAAPLATAEGSHLSLGPRGPFCVRRGVGLTVQLQGHATARVVVLTAR
jgi:hypothetical protein